MASGGGPCPSQLPGLSDSQGNVVEGKIAGIVVQARGRFATAAELRDALFDGSRSIGLVRPLRLCYNSAPQPLGRRQGRRQLGNARHWYHPVGLLFCTWLSYRLQEQSGILAILGKRNLVSANRWRVAQRFQQPLLLLQQRPGEARPSQRVSVLPLEV